MESWQLALVVLASYPLMAFSVAIIAKQSKKQYKRYREQYGKLEGMVEEDYAGYKIVKLFCEEESSQKIFDDINGAMTEADRKSQWISGFIYPTMTRNLKLSLEDNDVDALGPVLRENWEIKKSLAKGISNPAIDRHYEAAIAAGATGGKLLGAGGGGFLLFYCPTAEIRENVRKSLTDLKEMPFELDQAGCSILMM